MEPPTSTLLTRGPTIQPLKVRSTETASIGRKKYIYSVCAASRQQGIAIPFIAKKRPVANYRPEFREETSKKDSK
jgi:hypothetical protein